MDGRMGRDRVERNMGACLVQVLVHEGRMFGTSLVLSTKTYQSVPKRISKVPKPVLICFDIQGICFGTWTS